ncbi:MAG: zinc ribbon domain-containing protein [Kiritimatiellae bacterium]|jgi:ribosomal protein S27AE|nr:zinc ribbon domain-containing protein [Kiritimatiellia bacterium]
MMIKTCSRCGAEYTDTRIYCGKCGTKIGRLCDTCGEIVSDDHAFCGRCGSAQGLQKNATPNASSHREPTSSEQDANDIFAEVELDRARFERISPRLQQQEIARIFESPDTEGDHE